MGRRRSQLEIAHKEVLGCVEGDCRSCGAFLWNKYDNHRTVRTLGGVIKLRLKIRRCQNCECVRFHQCRTSGRAVSLAY